MPWHGAFLKHAPGAVLALALIGAGACTPLPTPVTNSPGSITMKASPDAKSDAAETAQKHCESWNKNAILASDRPASGGDSTVTYRCR